MHKIFYRMKKTADIKLFFNRSFIAICFIASTSYGAPVILDMTESQCWASGSEVENVFNISGIESEQLSGQWRLSVAGHTVARGETALSKKNGIIPFNIAFTLPQLKQGVTADLTLSLSVTGSDSGVKLATTNKTISSFSADVFANRNKWLKSLNIVLLDPEKATVELFDSLNIPYRFIRSADSLAEVTQGVVIVGEGVSLKENKGLWNVLTGVAARGVPVLCLALMEGEMKVAGMGPTELPKSSSLIMKRHQIIREIDKRLDINSWCGERMIASHSIMFTGERGPVTAVIKEDNTEWLWLEQSFENTNAKLILCQFLLVKHWKQSPVPQYLLLKLLENISPQKVDK